MKPRLGALPLTEEDSFVLVLALSKVMNPYRFALDYMRADRRDADLMLFLVSSLPWNRTVSKACLYLRLQQAVNDPANWETILIKTPTGYVEPS